MRIANMKLTFSLIGVVMLICAAVVLYITIGNPFEEDAPGASTLKEDLETVPLMASIGYRYADLDELAKDSDVIAFVETGKVVKVHDEGAIPFTDIEFTVMEPIHNVAEKEKIIVKFSGGIVKGEDGKLKNMEIPGDAVPQKGEEFLIFAKQREPDIYFTAGAPQGRYVLEDGVISPIGEYDHIISADGIGAEELKKELMQMLTDE